MRVIAGKSRRMRLELPPESSARPFLEKARGALFNALMASVPGARVLDLYAGSGALGIEALSRGAESCVFVEREKKSALMISSNLERCGLADEGEVICGDVASVTGRLREQADLIFLDPPFPVASQWMSTSPQAEIVENTVRLLSPDGLLVLRIEEEGGGAPSWGGLQVKKDRIYGRSRVCWYMHKTD